MPGEYPLDGLIARVDYHHGGKEAVLALKSGTRPSAAKTMAWMMTAWMEEEDWILLPFDCILPAPSAPSLFRERGEHAVLLAKYLSRQTGSVSGLGICKNDGLPAANTPCHPPNSAGRTCKSG